MLSEWVTVTKRPVAWVPSVALAEIIRFVFLENVPWGETLANLGSVIGISLLLYAVVVWKVRQSDR